MPQLLMQPFGSGTDGDLHITTNTTEAPTDSACTGTSGLKALTATNAGFAPGQLVWIHQTKGTGADNHEVNVISAYTAGTITLQLPMDHTYASGAQVRKIPQYASVTVDSGVMYSPKAYDGTVGGALVFACNGRTLNNTGNISATGKGFRQGTGPTAHNTGVQGEGTLGTGSASTAANGNGGGGGTAVADNSQPGAGGGHATTGTTPSGGAIGGTTAGNTTLTSINFGGAGGRAGASGGANALAATGHGGGIIIIISRKVSNPNGSFILCDGVKGSDAATSNQSGSGGGAGGSVLVITEDLAMGSNANLISAIGGIGGIHSDSNLDGAVGSVGRVAIAVCNISGNATPSTPAYVNRGWQSFCGIG